MVENLISHINKYTTLTLDEIEILENSFDYVSLTKRSKLHKPNAIATSKYFVVKGCLRSYFINKKGVEQILQFSIENWWIADYESLEIKAPSTLYIDAIEHSEVLILSRTKELELYDQIPNFERYFRKILAA